jgi:hypothetical protein
MRRSGTRLLLAGLGTAVVAFVGILVLNSIGELRGKATILWVGVLCASPFAFLLLGAEWLLGLKRQQGAVWLSAFDATQAMGSSGLVCIKLAVLTACVCLSWIILAATAAVWVTLWGDLTPWIETGRNVGAALAKIPAWSWACVALIAVVNFTAAGALLIAIGLTLPLRPKLFIAALNVVAVYFLLALWDGKQGWLLWRFWEAHAWLLAMALVAATFLALKKALGAGHLARRHFIPVLCLWIAHVGAVFALSFQAVLGNVSVPLPVLALGLGILTLPLGSIAFSPLALAAFRHR